MTISKLMHFRSNEIKKTPKSTKKVIIKMKMAEISQTSGIQHQNKNISDLRERESPQKINFNINPPD